MFVKNDSSGEHRYYNGMIGEVVNVSALGIEVRSKGSEDAFMLHRKVSGDNHTFSRLHVPNKKDLLHKHHQPLQN